jgi:hypothetical protein
MRGFDIAPFALPNCAPLEMRFEEPRDITKVVVTFKRSAPGSIGLSYLRKVWPRVRIEAGADMENPCAFGWIATDDWFNCEWQPAAIRMSRESGKRVTLTFKKLTAEFAEAADSRGDGIAAISQRGSGACDRGAEPSRASSREK